MGLFGKKQTRHTIVSVLFGQDARFESDCLSFGEGVHIDGFVGVDVVGRDEKTGTVSVSETGEIDGNIRATDAVILGTVRGDIITTGRVTLAPTARVSGSIECSTLEKEDGAIVQGSIRQSF